MEDSLSQQLVNAVFELKKLHKVIPMPCNIPYGEFKLMSHIELLTNKDSNGKGIPVSRINEKANMSMPAVSQVLSSLEKKDLIKRTMAQEDRRVILVSITDEGRALFDKMKVKMFSALDSMIYELGEEDTKELINLIKRLTVIITDIQREDD